MIARDFAELVDHARPSGHGWAARCPAHDDHRDSLTFADGITGLLLTCHTGCTVEAICQALHLTVSALFHTGNGHAAAAPRTAGRIVATYDYTDGAGVLVSQVVRLDPKAFRQRRPDGAGGWTWSTKDTPRVLYRLPALQGQKDVLVVEGEKDADRLAALGFVATTNSGGAGKWRPEYTAQLRAAQVTRVIVIGDNDRPGQAHADQVARACLAAGLGVRCVGLPGLPPVHDKHGEDVSDWLAVGHTADELAAVISETPPYTPPPDASGPGRQAILVPAATIKPEAVAWLDPGRLAVGALTMAVGLPDQGKSLIACDLAARLSAGMPLPPATRHRDAMARRRVLILTTEDALASTMVPRLIAAEADLGQISFVQMVQDADGAESLLTLEKDLDALEGAITRETPVLVVLDGLVGYLGNAKTHNDGDVRRVLSPFAALLARTNTAGLGLMHPPKVTTNLHYYAGGSVAFTAVPRVVLGVGPDPDDDDDNPRRFIAKLKGNLYGRVPTLAYRITAANDAAVPHLEWEPEPVRVNLAAVFSPPDESPEDRTSRRACEGWLCSFLADGPRPAKEMDAAAKDAGFKPMTVRRARERVCDSVKDGTRWVWFLRSAGTPRP